MNFWRSLAGMVELELASADIETSINTANEHGITLYYLNRTSDLSARFLLKRADYKMLDSLCQKRGDVLKLVARKGVYWWLKGLLRRPVVVIGLILISFTLFFLPTRVLFVRTEGNFLIPDRQIIAAGERCGVYFGASRRDVRSEKVKNAILSALPELQWAGVNTKGCVAIISVRERTEAETKEDEYVGSIVAERDGIITSCTILEGNALCSVGQVVQKGQVLISAYTDCGLCIQVTQARGEIFAQTERNLSVIAPTECIEKREIQNTKKKISLLLGKKRINLWKDSGIWDTTCDRMYEEYYVTLPGGYQLPLGVAVETGTVYQLQESQLQPEALEASIADYGKSYLYQHMVAGEIINSSETLDVSYGLIYLNGEYVCTEMIGRVQREQIGEENGENS